MAKAHKCPTCSGTKRVKTEAGPMDCLTCGATGVVWEPEEAADQPPADALDLTYQPE